LVTGKCRTYTDITEQFLNDYLNSAITQVTVTKAFQTIDKAVNDIGVYFYFFIFIYTWCIVRGFFAMYV